VKRLVRHLRPDPSKVLGLIWKNVCFPFTVAAAELRYDRSFGIDTAGVIEASELGTGASAKGYHGMPPKIAEYMICQIAPRAKEFAFVDLGAGKGRVVLMAARYPFRKVIGVELSKSLCDIAWQNIQNGASRFHCVAPIEIIHADASTYAIPEGCCTLFLYNPFFGEIADRVVTNILRSFQTAPREIMILYYSDRFPARLLAPPFVKRELPAQPRDRLDRYNRFGLRAVMFELAPSPEP
jgi:hypothetical protein